MAVAINRVIFQGDARQLNSEIDKVENNVESLQGSFDTLKGAIAGVAGVAAIQSLLSLSDQLADLRDATNISIQAISGFSEAVARSGGSYESAQNAILRFVETIGEAAAGSASLQNAFAAVGVSLDDLRNLSEQDLLRKTVQGLGQIQDFGERARITTDLFGRSLRGVNAQMLAEQLDDATAANAEFARSAERAGEVAGDLENTFRRLQQNVLVALEPFANLANKLMENQSAMDQVVQAVVKISVALASLAAAAKVLSWIAGGFLAIKTAAMAMAAVTSAGFAGMATTIARYTGSTLPGFIKAFTAANGVVAKLSAIVKHLMITFGTTGPMRYFIVSLGKIAVGATGIAAALVGLNYLVKQAFDVDPIDYFATKLEELVNTVFPGLARGINWLGEKMGMAASPSQKRQEQNDDRNETQRLVNRAQTNQVLDQQRQVIDAQAKAQAEEEERRRQQEARLAQQQEDRFRQEISNLQEIFVSYRKNNEELAKRMRFENSLISMNEEQRVMAETMYNLESQYLNEVNRLLDIYREKQQSGNQEDLRLLPEIQAKIQSITGEYTEQLSTINELVNEKVRLNDIEQKRLETERQLQSLQQFGEDTRLENARKLRDLQEEIATMTMTESEKAYRKMARDAEESAQRAIDAENRRRQNLKLPMMSTEEEDAYRTASQEGMGNLISLTKEHQELSRSWNTGWKRSLNEYVDNVTNAATRAQLAFYKMTQSMEDTLMDFFKTGKFGWRNFLQTIVDELLRSQIQTLIARTFGSAFGQTTGSGLGRLMGFANGGVIPHNGPVIVGERGPEIISGAAGRVVTPNNQIGGSSNVVYNINAVDAMSFRQMIARDPAFLYAVTEQGRRKIPGG